VKKVLIIRFSSIGDIVLTTPVIRCLKLQIPGVQVHFLTKAPFAEVLNANPHIDKVWILEDNLAKLLSDLKNEHFDFVSDLHHNFRSLRVRSALGVKNVAFNKLNIEKWLLVNFKIDRLPKVHIVNRYMETVAGLGVKYDGKGLDYFIPATDDVVVSELPSPWNAGYGVFVIGAKHTTKRLPPEKIIEIINEMKLPVLLLGGKEDVQTAAAIANQCSAFALNGCGIYRLSQSASLVKQSRFIITHDTGLMHIAAAFHQRIISVWGNTIPGFGMTPLLPGGKGVSVIVENNNLSCRPCSKIGFEKCPKEHFRCMRDIDVKKIANQATTWWNDQYAGLGTEFH